MKNEIETLWQPTTLALVKECKAMLKLRQFNSLSFNNRVWVPGHWRVKKNEKADELPRLGSESETTWCCTKYCSPMNCQRLGGRELGHRVTSSIGAAPTQEKVTPKASSQDRHIDRWSTELLNMTRDKILHSHWCYHRTL